MPNKEIILPPLEKEDSVVYNLDERSGNSATLRAQEKVMYELWSLSHLASTIGLIYALDPPQNATVPACMTPGWASQILPQLRRLVNEPRNLQDVCQRIKDILSDGINTLLAPHGNQSSNCFVLTAYRTLVIHLLFPRPDHGLHTEALADAPYDNVIHSVGAFKDHAESWCRAASDCNSKDPVSVEPSLLVLGLDSCSRALGQLQGSLKTKTTEEDGRSTSRLNELTELAEALHRICKYPRLRTASALPMVKRHLKSLKQGFESLGHPTSPEYWLTQPMDFFEGRKGLTDLEAWISSASYQNSTPMSGTSVFDVSNTFDFNDLAAIWTEGNGKESHTSAGPLVEANHS